LVAPHLLDSVGELFGAELRAVVDGDLLELPSGGRQFARDAVQQLAGVP
jgi:hypothetical protein